MRFLSVDPVPTSTNDGGNFNRYWYANNNPYKYTDPDGREAGATFAVLTRHESGVAPGGVSSEVAVGVIADAAVSVAIDVALGGPSGEGAVIFAARQAARNADRMSDVARGAAGGDRASKAFTRAGKAEVKAQNAAANGGQVKCSNCGASTVPAQQSRAGVSPAKNEAHVDHIIAKSKGGDGAPNNGQVLCRDCNLKKGAK